MIGNSAKTREWIIGYILFNFLVFFYVYLFFYEEWVSTMISIIIPLLIWEILIFGILAPDEVFRDLFGGWDNTISGTRDVSPVPSIRAALISSGDY